VASLATLATLRSPPLALARCRRGWAPRVDVEAGALQFDPGRERQGRRGDGVLKVWCELRAEEEGFGDVVTGEDAGSVAPFHCSIESEPRSSRDASGQVPSAISGTLQGQQWQATHCCC
jgi:hypothetical protein